MGKESYAQATQRIRFEKLSSKDQAAQLEAEREGQRISANISYETQREVDKTRIQALARGLLRITVPENGATASAIAYFAPTGESTYQDEKNNKTLRPGIGKWITMSEAQQETGLTSVIIQDDADKVIQLRPVQEPLEDAPEDIAAQSVAS